MPRTSSHPIIVLAMLHAIAPAVWAGNRTAASYLRKDADWFRSEEGRRITENVLSWQSPYGSWPKNQSTTETAYSDDPEKLKGTFDNSATTNELRFLAKAFRATANKACIEAFNRGMDHIFMAQYPNGGWPQYYPLSKQYHRRITFNDNTMVRLMEFLREVGRDVAYSFVDNARRMKAQQAFDRGVDCILKCQIRVDGKLTAWCAQHDEKDLQPRGARTYELSSISGSESVGIIRLLMSIDRPSAEVIRSVEAAVAWFDTVKITGIRVEKLDGDKKVVIDPRAEPLWARFYEIGTNRPIFSGRDGVKKYSLGEIEWERRNGYAWYGAWGKGLPSSYSKWKSSRSQQ